MSTSVVEYSSSEQLVINISVFYIGVIIYTISLFYLLISSFHFKKKLDKLGDSLEDVNYNLHEEIKDTFGNFLQNKLAEVNDELLEEIDEVNCRLIKKIDAERKLRIDQNVKSSREFNHVLDNMKNEFNVHIDEVRNALLSKLFDINLSRKEISIKMDSNRESLQKKIEGIEFRQAEILIHLKKEIVRLSDNLMSKVKFDDALSLYQESPQLCEAKDYLFLLKNWDRRARPMTFQHITDRIMENFKCMTVRRDSNIRDIISFFLDNKIRAGIIKNGCYKDGLVDFSKGRDEVKNEIFRRYSFTETDKEWLNLNVFGNNKKLF